MNWKGIFTKYQLSFGFTLSLILVEAFLALLFPLFIGRAIGDAMAGHHSGVVQLGIIGIAALLVGVGRRFFDSRFYAKIYQDISPQVLSRIDGDQSSVKAARLGMIHELVEFMENSVPELISAVISLFGVIIVLATLNLPIFYGCLIVTLIIGLVYWMSSAITMRLNKASNDEFEKQVNVLARNDPAALSDHLRKMMHWNIKLSDLEAANFSVSWIALMGFLVGSILIATGQTTVEYSILFSLIMYVFQYIENVVHLPFFYQHWLRLQEITHRMTGVG